ncbi:unnamed protein product [Ranitomeya imitator]|uniref:ribonuclease H n=1 Tax=Ranitomeya imitator TaxID=111125 RepID=A0ABN9L3X5_9NEOB|nr:unnamed protein product [Ranitomeya imitator]
MILDSSQELVLLPPEKISALQREAQKLSQPRTHSLRFSMRVLGRMVAALEAVPFAQLARKQLHSLRVRWFRMESLHSVIASMEKGEFLASIDIQDAYLHNPIFPSHQRFLRFAVQEQHFQFVALPFDLTTAPRVFTKVMAATMAILHTRGVVVLSYLDNIFIKGPSFRACKEAVNITIDSLSRLGWKINFKKSSPVPAQRISYLGMILDSSQGLVLLPPEKISALQREAQKLSQPRTRSLRFSMRVLGKMVAALEAVPFAQLHLRPLQHALLAVWDRNQFSLDRRFFLPHRVRQSLRWWTLKSSLNQWKSFLPVHWLVVTTHASLLGWGAVFLHHTAQGRWSLQESCLPINILEIRAIRVALLQFHPFLAGRPIRIQSNNATAVAYINTQGGTCSMAAMNEVGYILRWAEENRSMISAVHIPGVDNWEADFLSRQGLDSEEWSLHPEIFHQICCRWGTPDVDLMASRLNSKVPDFIARSHDPAAIGADALILLWHNFRLQYIFPPLPLLPRVIKKIRAEGVPVAFLVAVTSIRRVSELAALSCQVPFLNFNQDKVVLRTYLSFLPKHVSSFHHNQEIVLPSLCPAPVHCIEKALHTLDLVRALKRYVSRAASLRRSDALFVLPEGPRKGFPASKATIAKWIRSAIQESYRVRDHSVPARIKAHSTRSVGLGERKETVRGVYSVIDQLSRTHLSTLERLIFHLVRLLPCLFASLYVMFCALYKTIITLCVYAGLGCFRIAQQEETNRMSANALAIVFAPCILRCPDTTDPLQSVQDIGKTTACVELIVMEQMNKYKARLKDINSLEFAENKAKSRLSLIRRSMGKGRLRSNLSPVISGRSPVPDAAGDHGLSTIPSEDESSEQKEAAMQQEERVLAQQIETLQKEK